MNENAKIEEAEYFLRHVIAAASDPAATRFETSAFLSAARSVLQYASQEAAGRKATQGKPAIPPKSGGKKWYQDAVGHDPLVAFLKEHRDINVHHRPLPMQTNTFIQLHGVVAFAGGSTTAPPDASLSQNDPSSGVSYEYYFEGWQGPEDVPTLCARYLAEIKRIVHDGRAQGLLTP